MEIDKTAASVVAAVVAARRSATVAVRIPSLQRPAAVEQMNVKQNVSETERIWRELSDRLRQFIQSRVKSTADVDDILQTVFLKIHQKLDSLRETERLESWVFQITRNAILDQFRKSDNTESYDAALLAGAPDETAPIAELSRCIVTLIDQLPDAQKRAVSMFELDGISQAQIAELESISLSAAKSRVQRGRVRLESLLRDCCSFQLDSRGNVIDYQRQDGACASNCNCEDSITP